MAEDLYSAQKHETAKFQVPLGQAALSPFTRKKGVNLITTLFYI